MCDNLSSVYPGAEEGVLVRRVPVLLLLLRSEKPTVPRYKIFIKIFIKMICICETSPLATQEQQIGVLVAGAGLRLDGDSTPGCTSSIDHFSLLAALTNSIRDILCKLIPL